MVPDDCGATTGASGADRTHSYSASICLLVARVCFAGKQEHSEAMRPIAKCCRGGLAGRRCCLNMAADPIAVSVVLGRGWFARASTRVAKRVRVSAYLQMGPGWLCARSRLRRCPAHSNLTAKRSRAAFATNPLECLESGGGSQGSTTPALRMWSPARPLHTSGECRRRGTPAPRFALAQTANSKREEGPGAGPGLLKKRAWETRRVCARKT